MKKIVFLAIALMLFSSIVFADGFFFDPTLRLRPDADESAQIGVINVDDAGYTLDLYVKVAPLEGEYFYWIVPLDEVPDEIDLKNFADSDFEEKVTVYNSGVTEARQYQSALASINSNFFLGQFIYTPLALFSFTVLFIPMIGGVSGGEQKALDNSITSFGELGSVHILSIENQSTLEAVFSKQGVAPNDELSEYLGKTVAVFSINPSSMDGAGLVASFKFNQNEKIYFPSGTTKFFDEIPEQFEVVVTAPKEFILEKNINPTIQSVGKEKRYFSYGSSMSHYGSYDSEKLAQQDIIITKTGVAPQSFSIKENFASFPGSTFFLGLIISLVLTIGTIIGYLNFKKKLNTNTVIRMLGFYTLLIALCILLPIMLVIVPTVLLSIPMMLIGSGAASFAYMLPLLMVFVGMIAFTVLIGYLFFFWKKSLMESFGFSKSELFIVAALAVVLNILVALIFALIP